MSQSEELRRVNYELIYAVREGRLEKARDLINLYGLSYSEAWANGYVLLRDALERRYTAIAELLLRSGAKVNSTNHTRNPSMTPLHYAVRNGYIELVEIILDRGAYINAKDNTGNTPLYHAIEGGKIQVTELLLKHGADVNTSDGNGKRPLHLAAGTGSLEIVKKLLEYDSYVNCIYSGVWQWGYTPLHMAVERGSKEVVLLLLERGARVDVIGQDNITVLHVAAQKGNICILEVLLDHGACINSLTLREGYTPLHFACKHNFKTAVELLLKRGADVNTGTKETPLHIAIKRGHKTFVKLLLDNKARVDDLDNDGKTTLQLAVEKGCLEIVSDILKYCPDIGNKSNRSSLEIAVHGYGDNTKIVEALLEYGFNVTPDDANNSKLLRTAVEKGYLKIVEDLLKHGADDNLPSIFAFTPLHSAAKYKQIEIAKLLLNYKADVNARNRESKTPIFYAIDSNNLEMTKLLLSHQANIINSPNLLHIAVKNDCKDIVEALLQHGADVNASDDHARTALHFTCITDGYFFEYKKNTDSYKVKGQIAQLLLSNGANVDDQTKAGETTLFAAIQKGYTKVVEAVLKYNANVNSVNKRGYTPLHLAALEGYEKIGTMLIKKGANVNAKEENGYTPLHLAALNGHQKFIGTLLKSGGDIKSQGVNGNTALHMATEKGHVDVVVTLLKHGADINIAIKQKHPLLDYAKFARSVRNFNTCDSDSDDDFDRDRGVCTYELCAKALKRHMIQMKTANIFLSQQNLLSLHNSYQSSERNFERDCKEEIANMKSEMIKDLHISFYDILVKSTSSLAMYMRNKSLVQALNSGRYKHEFPIYSGMIESKFRKGMQRKALIAQGIKIFNFLYPAVPCDCTEEIFSYLSVEDMKILLKAGGFLLK